MRWRILFLLALAAAPPALAAPFHAGGNQHSGEAVICDLPVAEHLLNSVGRDGLGLCVFTSIDHAARWANEPALIGFRDFMTTHPGGGWPEKVDEYIPRMAASKGLAAPDYLQHTGGDAEFLRLALKTGRYVCVTYSGRDGVFYRGPIAHMVNLVHLSEKWAVIHDNNYPGKWLWMPPAEFLKRWRGSGGGWAIALLKAGPPPIPVNVGEQDSTLRCADVYPSTTDSGQPTDLEWKADRDHAGFFYLYRRAVQIGTWHPDGRGYKELRADGSWSEPGVPPIPLPAGAILNFGLDPDRVSGEARYRRNGKEVSRRDALAALGGLPDDSGKLRLTVVGDSDFRQRVLTDLSAHPELVALRDRLLVQDYPPEHWAVAGVGFAPGITLQTSADADGKAAVLVRLRSYDGPENLAAAIRKADPNYRPERDPEPAKSPANPIELADPMKYPPPVWGLGGLVLALIASRLGIPGFARRTLPTDLKGLVRQTLLDVLKGLSEPRPAPDEEIRKQLLALLGERKA